jgi:16S rRNA (guanine527-N7)-methyltransferase
VTDGEVADLPVAPEPPALLALLATHFPDSQQLLRRYADWLAAAGTIRGLIGPREVPRLWDRHILNSAVLAELLPMNTRIVDIGSGAGLPGLAVACVRPDLQVDLVDSQQRRTDFLNEVVADLGLNSRVRVTRGRAEDAAVIRTVGSSTFVTARAVAPLDRLVRWCLPLLVRGGTLLALKGESAEDELRQHQRLLDRLKVEVAGISECGAGIVQPVTRVVRLVRR